MKKGWEIKKLSDVLEVQNGYAFNSKKFNTSLGTPLIRIRDLKNGERTQTLFEGDFDQKYIVSAGDLLIGMDGEFGCYEWKGQKALLNQRVCKLQNFSTHILPRFLFYGVNSHLKAIEDITGYATVKHLSSKQILNIEFPVPPLAEQRRIVGILDEAFAGIAEAKAHAEKNLQNARELFESHLNAVFSQRGDGWEEKRLGDVAEKISTGPFGTMLHKSDYVTDGIPLVNPMNIVNSKIVPSSKMMVDEATRERLIVYALKRGDIVIARRGKLGRCALVTEHEEGWLCGTGSFFVRLKETITGEFFVSLFSSKPFRERLESYSVGTTMSNLNHGILKELVLPLPPLKEQHKIMARAQELSSETQSLESIYQQKLTSLEELKKSLLHQAFTGKLTMDN